MRNFKLCLASAICLLSAGVYAKPLTAKFSWPFAAKHTANASAHKSISRGSRSAKPAKDMLELTYNKGANRYDSSFKTLLIFDANKNLTLQIKGNYKGNGKMDTILRVRDVYDSKSRNLVHDTDMYAKGVWSPYSHDSTAYDANGQESYNSEAMYMNGKWNVIYATRNTYAYNANNTPTEGITEYMDTTGNWVKSQKLVADIDGTGKIIGATMYAWVDSTATWEEQAKMKGVEFFNNDLNHPIKYTISANVGGNIYIDVVKYTSTITTDGKPLTSLTQVTDGFKLVNEDQETYTYDVQGMQTSYKREIWKNNAWKVAEQNRDANTYNADNNILTDTRDTFEVSKATWNKDYMYIYEYDQNSGIAPAHSVADLDVYPNPANTQLHINMPSAAGEMAAISITDIAGRQLSVQNVSANGQVYTVNIAELQNGVYFVRIVKGSEVYSQPFMKN